MPWFYLHITSGAMYPGVPEVSWELSGFQILATPRSVTFTYPSVSRTRFSGLISLWMTFLLWRYSRDKTMQAMKNSKWKNKIIMFLHKQSVQIIKKTYLFEVLWNDDACQCGTVDPHRSRDPWQGRDCHDLKMRSSYSLGICFQYKPQQ